MAIIHETAVIGPEVKLHDSVEVGPYSILQGNIEIGEGTKIHSHVTISGVVSIGARNEIYQYTNIGNPPQDLSYKGEPTKVEIGDDNVIREYVTIHRGTMKDNGITKLGNKNFIMGYVHIAHDCQVADNVIMINLCQLAGHVKIGNGVRISGASQVSQFVSVGEGAFIAGGSAIDRDIPHHCVAMGNRAYLKGINIIGLKRRGFSKAEISEVVDFYRMMEASALSPKAFISHQELMKEYENNAIIKQISSFIDKSEIGIASFIN